MDFNAPDAIPQIDFCLFNQYTTINHNTCNPTCHYFPFPRENLLVLMPVLAAVLGVGLATSTGNWHD